jgi:glycosyltransferase involved in cell wall biosynthesis
MTTPQISALIAVRNGERHLAEAINSCLSQTLRPSEIIVVDDGSDDGTSAIIQSYGPDVVHVRQDWSGVAAAYNAGVARTRSPIVAFLDHDDLWEPNKLEAQSAILEGDADLDAVFCMAMQFISPEVDADLRARLSVPTQSQEAMASSSLFVTKTALERFGPFTGGRDATAFVMWFLRARSAGLRFRTAPQVLMRRRVHSSNSGIRDKLVNRQQYLDAAREMIMRRRQDQT